MKGSFEVIEVSRDPPPIRDAAISNDGVIEVSVVFSLTTLLDLPPLLRRK